MGEAPGGRGAGWKAGAADEWYGRVVGGEGSGGEGSGGRGEGSDGRRTVAVPWDEAREVLAVVLMLAALLHLSAPMIRYAGLDSPFSLWDNLYGVLGNVSALPGLLVLGAAVTVCTTPASDMVPRLRNIVYASAVLIAGLGMLAIVNVLSVPTAGDSASFRIALVAWRPGPAVVLSATAAWMARRVVVFG